jgi:hypothetical protein
MRDSRAPIPAPCGQEATPRNHAKPRAYVAKRDHRMMQQGGLARGAGLLQPSIELQNVVEFRRRELPARRVRDLDPPSRLEEHAGPGNRERRAGQLHFRVLAVL